MVNLVRTLIIKIPRHFAIMDELLILWVRYEQPYEAYKRSGADDVAIKAWQWI